MVNNIPLNGWPQLKDLEAVQPTLDRLDKIEAWKRTVKEETFTGDDITIENALALPARSLITEINAIQDLHGYDHPWARGAGDNKFGGEHFADVVKEQFSDAVIDTTAQTVSYLASGISDKILYSDFDANTRYTFMYEIASGSFTNLGVEYIDGTTAEILTSPFVTDTNKSVRYLKGVWHSGETVMKYNKFGVFKGVLTADDYTPYANICPISGRTAAVITRSDGDEISEDFTIQLGQTVYGGTVNLVTGAARVTAAFVTFDGSNDETIATYSARNGFQFTSGFSGMASGDFVNGKCNQASIATAVTQHALRLFDNTALWLYAQDDLGINTVEGLRTYLANNPLQICYELAEPIELTLTPTEVQMLKGYNRVTLSDGYGTIELKALTGANWS